jgi:2-amino-4-hydroxy-6-hydroxymethyldihydropteridine diphosphokinase
MSHVAFVALGSNLDDPHSRVRRGFAALDALPGTRLLARSSLYASAPVGYVDQPDFVNAVAKISTSLTPQALLQALLNIEHQNGRERTFQNAPRTLDLDVLLYDDLIFHEHGLTIPHPQMHRRAFVGDTSRLHHPRCRKRGHRRTRLSGSGFATFTRERRCSSISIVMWSSKGR